MPAIESTSVSRRTNDINTTAQSSPVAPLLGGHSLGGAMETETPRLVQLLGGDAAHNDGRVAAGLSRAQSPASSPSPFTMAVGDCVKPLSTAVTPATNTHLREHDASPLSAAGGDGTHHHDNHSAESYASSSASRSPGSILAPGSGGAHSLLRPSPSFQHHGNGTESPALSLQSNLVTPALSSVATPRANARSGGGGGDGSGGGGISHLATFVSISATPSIEADLDREQHRKDTGDVALERGTDGGGGAASPAAPMDATQGLDEDGVVIDVSESSGKKKDRPGKRDHFQRSVDDESLEFASFAPDASFMSVGSSNAGGGAGGGRQYASLYGAVFHIFKGNVGAGVFLLPTYYQDSGYVVGTICVLLLGCLMVDCTVSLLHVKHRINRVEVKTYPAVVEFVLGDWFQKFTQFALVFTQFGFCVMFLQYAASMFASLFDASWVYMVAVAISTVLVTPMTFLSNKLHLLVYASMLAAVFVVIILTGTTVVDVQHLSTQGVAVGVVAAVPTARLIVFLSGHMFSLEGIGIVLPVENSLPPEKRVPFGRVLRYTLVAIILFYVVFGVLGYIAYGEKLHTSVVLALPPSLVKRALQVLLGLSLIFGFPIQYVPAIQIVDKAFHVNINEEKTKAFLVRVGLNVAFGVIATFIGGDTINIFASFLGAFAGVHLMITIPTLLALQVEHALNDDRDTHGYKAYLLLMFQGPYTIKRSRYYLYLLLALVVWIGGLYYTFVALFVK